MGNQGQKTPDRIHCSQSGGCVLTGGWWNSSPGWGVHSESGCTLLSHFYLWDKFLRTIKIRNRFLKYNFNGDFFLYKTEVNNDATLMVMGITQIPCCLWCDIGPINWVIVTPSCVPSVCMWCTVYLFKKNSVKDQTWKWEREKMTWRI